MSDWEGAIRRSRRGNILSDVFTLGGIVIGGAVGGVPGAILGGSIGRTAGTVVGGEPGSPEIESALGVAQGIQAQQRFTDLTRTAGDSEARLNTFLNTLIRNERDRRPAVPRVQGVL